MKISGFSMKLSNKRRTLNADVMAQLRDPDEVEPPPTAADSSDAGRKKSNKTESEGALAEAKRRAERGDECAAQGLRFLSDQHY